jgi:hypothetical protein
MRICRDERATRSFILPTVGEREGGRIKRYNEGPKKGSRDKTWGDGLLRLRHSCIKLYLWLWLILGQMS